MSFFVCFIAWFVLFGTIAYFKLKQQQAFLALAAGLFITWIFSHLTFLGLLFSAGLLGGISFILSNQPLRTQYLTSWLLKQFRRMQPKLSETEKIALNAGNAWWDYELFSGNPNFNTLIVKLPPPKLTEAESTFLNGPVLEVCEKIVEWEVIQSGDLPEGVWTFLKERRFFGLMIPKEYDGLGFSAYAHSEIIKRLASKSLTLATTVSIPNSLGPAELILHYGTDTQKQKYLKKLAHGAEIPCFGLTSLMAGSDATAITDSGVVCYKTFQGEKTLGIELNFEKRYITLSPIATLIGLAFKLYDPNALLGSKVALGITCALVQSHVEGISIGRRHNPLNCAFQNGPIAGQNVFIPIESIIGGAKGIGQGWQMLVERLGTGRAISLPAISTGMAKAVCALTGAYARIRTQFKHPIGHFEGIEAQLAQMAGNLYIMNATSKITATALDAGESPTVISAIVKYHLTEMGRKIVLNAMDIQGGKGIMMGPKNELALYFQACPIPITVEGANILTRNMIIFGQGIMQSHPHLLKLLNTLNLTRQQNALNRFDKQFMNYLRFSLSNLARSVFFGLSRGYFISIPVLNKTKRYAQQITWASSVFATVCDLALLSFGGKLKTKEKISARLGDLLSFLYLSSCCLKHFENNGNLKEDFVLLEWSLGNLLSQYWETLEKLLNNFPNRYLNFLYKCLLMPFKPMHPPKDGLDKQVAKILLNPSTTRVRLLENVEFNQKLEQNLKIIIQAELLEKRIQKAIQEGVLNGPNYKECIQQARHLTLISQAEAQILEAAHIARMEVISVDDFEPNEAFVDTGAIFSRVS